MRAPLSRGISVAFSDLDSLLVMDLGARSSPAAAKRCAKGAGLEGAPKSITSSKRSPNFLCAPHFFELRSDPRQALCVRAALAAPTYIRPGTTRPIVPHARCEGAGSKGDGTILFRGIFQPCPDPVTHPPWIHKLLLSIFDLRSSPFEDGTSRHQASFKITPKRHQQLACQCHNGDAADAAFRGTDSRPVPNAQIAFGLIAQPHPGEFDPGGSPLSVAGLADPLVMRHVSALKRARR